MPKVYLLNVYSDPYEPPDSFCAFTTKEKAQEYIDEALKVDCTAEKWFITELELDNKFEPKPRYLYAVHRDKDSEISAYIIDGKKEEKIDMHDRTVQYRLFAKNIEEAKEKYCILKAGRND